MAKARASPRAGSKIVVIVKAVCDNELFAAHPEIEDVYVAKGAFDEDPTFETTFKDVKIGDEIEGILKRRPEGWRISKILKVSHLKDQTRPELNR